MCTGVRALDDERWREKSFRFAAGRIVVCRHSIYLAPIHLLTCPLHVAFLDGSRLITSRIKSGPRMGVVPAERERDQRKPFSID